MGTFDLNGAAERLDAWLDAPRDPSREQGVPVLKENIKIEQAGVASEHDLIGFIPTADAPTATGREWILTKWTVEVRE